VIAEVLSTCGPFKSHNIAENPKSLTKNLFIWMELAVLGILSREVV